MARWALLGSARALGAIGVFSAAVCAVSVNVVAARFYERWDLTSARLYTLSGATVETLRALDQPVELVVFLSASDPLTLSVQHMLTAYGAETQQLRTRYVDPDRNPAEFLALQNEYGVVAGKTEDGRIVTDASIVVARGDKHWYITTDDMVVYDEEDDRARPALEQALTEGIRNVLSREKVEVCFTRGHGEISSDDGGPQGLAELKFRLRKDNYETREVDLVSSVREQTLDGCGVVVIGGPETPFTPSASRRVEKYYDAGGSLLLLLNPVLDDGNRIRPTGLEHVTEKGGIGLGTDFVLERDPELRLPQGLGETFFATPAEHPITKGMVSADSARYRALLTAAQSLTKTVDSVAKPLLVTSKRAFSVQDIRPFVEEGRAVEKRAGDSSGPFIVGAASERKKRPGSDAAHGARMVVFGSANVAFGRSWRDPTLLGNRVLVESGVSWLASQPSLVSVPQKDSHAAGINLTEDDLTSILWYVLVHMPMASLHLGGLILYRRRSAERRSRARGEPKPPPPAASSRDGGRAAPGEGGAP